MVTAATKCPKCGCHDFAIPRETSPRRRIRGTAAGVEFIAENGGGAGARLEQGDEMTITACLESAARSGRRRRQGRRRRRTGRRAVAAEVASVLHLHTSQQFHIAELHPRRRRAIALVSRRISTPLTPKLIPRRRLVADATS